MITDQRSFANDLTGACTGALLSFLVVAMSGPLIPLMAIDLGASPGTLGLLVSVANIGALIAAVPSGFLIGRIGSRVPMVLATLLISISCLFVYLIPTLPSLFFGLVVFGIGRTVSAIGIQCYVGGLRGTKDVSSNFGWYGTAVAVGQMVGPTVSGLSMQELGYAATWLVMAILCGATAIVLLFVIKPENIEKPQRPPQRIPLRSQISQLTNGSMVIGILSSFAIIFALSARTSFYPVFLKQLGYSAAMIGVISSARGFFSILARMGIGPAVRGLGGRLRVLHICLVVLAVGIGTASVCRSLPLILLNAMIMGIGFGPAMPLSQAVVFDGVGTEKRSVAMGVRMTGNRLAQMSGPLLFGFVIEWFTISVAFVVGGILLFLASTPLLRHAGRVQES